MSQFRAYDKQQTCIHTTHSTNTLHWHPNIPDDEIWLKIGGDKGGGSFKMNFQVVNVAHPNSPENTLYFCVFEASDTLTNLHIALDKYRDQRNSLESQTWRYKHKLLTLYMYTVS